jgi:hypothetical protein
VTADPPQLAPGVRFDLARNVIQALIDRIDQPQRAALVAAFGIKITDPSPSTG